jgi:hypothetical protein
VVVGRRELRVALEGGVVGQGEAADPAAEVPGTPLCVGGDDEDPVAARDERGDDAGDPAAAAVAGAVERTGRPLPPPPVADREARGRVGEAGGLGARDLAPVRRLPHDLDRGGLGGAGVAQDEPGLDRAVPVVDLEAERRVDRAVGVAGIFPAVPNATARARTPPDSTVKRTCRFSPIGRGSASVAAGTSSLTAGLPWPNGASRSSSSASASPSSSPATTASTRSTGRRSSSVSVASRGASKAARNASTSSRPHLEPGRGAVAAVAPEVRAHAFSPRAGRTPGRCGRSRSRSPRRARSHGGPVVALGDPARHDATRPGAVLAGEDVGGARAQLGDLRLRREEDACSVSRRSAFTRSSSSATRAPARDPR